METGMRFWSLVWFSVAERIIELAGATYELDAEQRRALAKVFLRAGDYRVALKTLENA